MATLEEFPHRRYNPLTGEHIIVSPHRTKRPWQGATEPGAGAQPIEYDPQCYLCPGNARATGDKNPDFDTTYVFPNDYAAVLPPPVPEAPAQAHPLLAAQTISGGCDVIIFHKRHDLTIARLSVKEIEHIVDGWTDIYHRRGSQPDVKYIQIFENKGSIMGCSNPHPHGQVWSLSQVPTIPSTELKHMGEYAEATTLTAGNPLGPKGKACLLCDYASLEVEKKERIVVQNDHWIALVPWWATWPFEVLLLPYKRHIPSIDVLTSEEKTAFADALSRVTKRYDNLFKCSFAYSMGIHQRPTPSEQKAFDSDDPKNLAHLHLHFAPPLLRSATVKKFLVGFELMAEAQRDITPEQAADRLRACSETHYLDA